MNADVEEKNTVIAKLRKKLKNLQKQQSKMRDGDADSQYSAESQESMERVRHASLESIERARHVSDSSHTAIRSPEYPISSSSGRGKTPGSGSEETADYNRYMTKSQTPVYESDLGTRSRSHHSSGSDDNAEGQRSGLKAGQSFSRTPILQEEPEMFHSGVSSLPHSDSSRQHSFYPSTEHQEKIFRENDKLKLKLKNTEDLNESLRNELRLYENIRPSRGRSSTGVSFSHEPVTTGLEQHLLEIRALRKRLEESIQNNDRLREQLQQQLDHMAIGQSGIGHFSVF